MAEAMTAEELVRRVLAKQNPDDATVKAAAAKIDAYIAKVNRTKSGEALRPLGASGDSNARSLSKSTPACPTPKEMREPSAGVQQGAMSKSAPPPPDSMPRLSDDEKAALEWLKLMAQNQGVFQNWPKAIFALLNRMGLGKK